MNRGLLPVDRRVFTDDDFAPSMVAVWPGTTQIEKSTEDGIENFSLSSAHEATLGIPN
jgi:hypothetical protein